MEFILGRVKERILTEVIVCNLVIQWTVNSRASQWRITPVSFTGHPADEVTQVTHVFCWVVSVPHPCLVSGVETSVQIVPLCFCYRRCTWNFDSLASVCRSIGIIFIPQMYFGTNTIYNSQIREHLWAWSEVCQTFFCLIQVRQDKCNHFVVCCTRIVLGSFSISFFCYKRNSQAQYLRTVCIDIVYRFKKNGQHIIVECTASISDTSVTLDGRWQAFVSNVNSTDDVIGRLDELVQSKPWQISKITGFTYIALESIIVSVPVITGVCSQRIHVAQHFSLGNHELWISHIRFMGLATIYQITLCHFCRDTIQWSFQGTGGSTDLFGCSSVAFRECFLNTARQCYRQQGCKEKYIK